MHGDEKSESEKHVEGEEAWGTGKSSPMTVSEIMLPLFLLQALYGGLWRWIVFRGMQTNIFQHPCLEPE